MLKFWRNVFFLFVATFIVAESLIGVTFYQNDSTQCGLSLYHLPTLTETKWIKLNSHYPFPCFEAMKYPNQIHITLATDSNDDVFITVILADWDSKVYKVAYLDPETNEFSAFKELSTPAGKCFHKDSQITALLNFQMKNGIGKIRISKPSGCDVKFHEEDFFGNKTNLGLFKTVPGRTTFSLDENEANNTIFQAIQYNQNMMERITLDCDPQFVTFNLPFTISRPSMFVSGNYAFFKNLGYNISATAAEYTYSMIDLTQLAPEQNVTITSFKWRNFAYIFDEKYFGKSLSLPAPGVQDFEEEENSASNDRILKISLMLAFIGAFSKLVFC